MAKKLDIINQKILLTIQSDAKHPIAKIAETSGISTSPCHKRIKQLEAEKIITNYAANLDLKKICDSVTFIADITLETHTVQSFKGFEAAVMAEETLVDCYQTSGAYDYCARFVCRNAEDYKDITDRLMQKAPIKNISSACVLAKTKAFSGYPLKHLLEMEG